MGFKLCVVAPLGPGKKVLEAGYTVLVCFILDREFKFVFILSRLRFAVVCEHSNYIITRICLVLFLGLDQRQGSC